MALCSHFSRGLQTWKVPMTMHRDNRLKLLTRLQSSSHTIPANAWVLLKGGESTLRHDTDHEPLFRQESFFHYLFGVKEPDFYGAIDVSNKKSILFIPRLPASYAIWMGEIFKPPHFQEVYMVDEVHYVDEIEKFFSARNPSVIYTLYGQNTDSDNFAIPATFAGIEKFKVDKEVLFPELVECRVIKSKDEIDLLRYVNKISSEAHIEVMRRIRPGMTEYQMEAIFQYYCAYYGGVRNMSYTCISACGPNSANLHYGHAGAPNDKLLLDGEMILADMGGEYHCYASDITRTYPVNGKYTEDQKQIYESVLAAQQAVMDTMKAGVLWSDMHLLANRVICEHLKKHGFLKGEVEDMLANSIGPIFMPHGLGHFMGIDTHDVGGYPGASKRSSEENLKRLRTARRLEVGMVITVEPGIYFVDAQLDAAFNNPAQAQFLVPEKINRFRKFGGVRIEDDVVVTETGIENLTRIPRSVHEIEAILAQKKDST